MTSERLAGRVPLALGKRAAKAIACWMSQSGLPFSLLYSALTGMIFETGANNLPIVIEILRPDKAHHGIDEERIVVPRQAIVARLHRHLIGAEVRASRQRRALPGFKVEAVFSGDTVELGADRPRFIEHRQLHAELF